MISICIAVRNQGHLIDKTLDSIFRQYLPNLEVIVTDDGSTDNTAEVVKSYPVQYLYLDNDEYHNGVFAKNSSLKHAHGDIIIQQSADVIHTYLNTIQQLVHALRPGNITLATIYNSKDGKRDEFQYTGPKNCRPFFFLGACWRSDICTIGGYDPDFGHVCWFDDNWHADCLINTCGIKPIYLDVIGLHQDHSRPKYDTEQARKIYNQKKYDAIQGKIPYISSTGPWPYEQGVSVCELQ